MDANAEREQIEDECREYLKNCVDRLNKVSGLNVYSIDVHFIDATTCDNPNNQVVADVGFGYISRK